LTRRRDAVALPVIMRFGINTFLFTSPFTNDSTRWFRQFKQWGFDSVEIPIEDPAHIDPAYVKRELDRHGLVCGSVCACLGPDRDLRGTAQQQRNSLDYLKRVIDQMVVLGSRSVVGPVYSSVGRAEAVPPAEYRKQWKTVVKHLKVLAAYAQQRGKQICLEPLNRFETDFINTCDQALKLVKAVGCPALKLHLDTFHMNIEEKSLGDAIRAAGRRLVHFHACENDRGTPGTGNITWGEIAAALREIGYDGPVVIESFTSKVQSIARAAAIWRPLAPSQDALAGDGVKFLKTLLA